MTEPEYRQDDRSEGYCDCGEPLTNVTVGGRGYCEIHGWQYADWDARPTDRDPGDETDDDGAAESQEGLYTAWEILGGEENDR